MASALIVFGDKYLIRLPLSCFTCADEFKEGSVKRKGSCIRDKAPFLPTTCLPLDALLAS